MCTADSRIIAGGGGGGGGICRNYLRNIGWYWFKSKNPSTLSLKVPKLKTAIDTDLASCG